MEADKPEHLSPERSLPFSLKDAKKMVLCLFFQLKVNNLVPKCLCFLRHKYSLFLLKMHQKRSDLKVFDQSILKHKTLFSNNNHNNNLVGLPLTAICISINLSTNLSINRLI